jgi:hypothetical protein
MVVTYKICDAVLKSCDPYFSTSLQFMVHKPYFLPFRITRVHHQFLVRFVSIINFLCNVCRSLFVFWLLFIWPLYCLFFDLRKLFDIFKLFFYSKHIFRIFWFWAYLMQIIQETRRAHLIWYIRFYYTVLSRVNTAADGLLVSEGIIRPVVRASALTCIIRYIYYESCNP